MIYIYIYIYISRPQLLEELSPEEVREQVKRHIYTTMGHFRDRIHVWDVVNEALAPDGTFSMVVYISVAVVVMVLQYCGNFACRSSSFFHHQIGPQWYLLLLLIICSYIYTHTYMIPA